MLARMIAVFTAAVVVSGAMGPAVSGAEPAKARILLLWTRPDLHAYGTHMYRAECQLLAKCLNQTSGVDAIVPDEPGWPKDESLFKDLKSIVFYSSAAGDVLLDPERREKVNALLKSGVGYTAIHWATATNDVNLGPDYLLILGGWFNFAHSGLAVEKQPLEFHEPEHPLFYGWEPYDLHDEIYLNLKFHERAKKLITVKVRDKEQTVAWVMERPDSKDGRSFGTTLGHFHDNFKIEAFRKMLANGILWTAHVDIDKEKGAPVEVSEEDLKLPPPPEAPKPMPTNGETK